VATGSTTRAPLNVSWGGDPQPATAFGSPPEDSRIAGFAAVYDAMDALEATMEAAILARYEGKGAEMVAQLLAAVETKLTTGGMRSNDARSEAIGFVEHHFGRVTDDHVRLSRGGSYDRSHKPRLVAFADL